MIKRLLRKLILWALGGEYPKIFLVRKTERASETPASPQMIDIRVSKKERP